MNPEAHFDDTPSPARLEIFEGGEKTREFELQGDCRIGRHSTNDLQLPHHRVSREHAWIQRRQDGSFWIVDRGSSNGTFLNHLRLHQATRLSDGDVLRIGDFELRFHALESGSWSSAASAATEVTVLSTLPQVRWLLVADIAGFSGLSHRVSADELRDLVARWRDACHGAVGASRGHLNKQIGDGLLFYWASDAADPAGIARSLQRLATLQQAAEPPFRINLHFCPPDSVSLERRGTTEELIGGPVNFTFRMDAVAKQLKVSQLVSEAAAAKLKGVVGMESLGKAKVADFPGEHAFFRPQFEEQTGVGV